MRHLIKTGALVCVLALTAACGGDGDETATESPSSSESTSSATPSESSSPTDEPTEEETSEPPEPQPEDQGTVIEVTFKNGKITPSGERVEAKAGEPITFEIDADAPGELHAHSTPEHSIDFEPGTSSYEIVIDQPGIVEVELHDPPVVVVQLEVR